MLAIALLLAIGHSAGVQAIAWMGMFIERVQTESVCRAVVSVLDGTRPCQLCDAAKALAAVEAATLPDGDAGKAPAKQHPAPTMVGTIDEPWRVPAAGAAGEAPAWPSPARLANGHAGEPPVPPPRA